MGAGEGRIGAVVIGRNEGDRLRRCLEALLPETERIVYVDSGSTDGSLALAQALGVVTVALDAALPFSAARARNAGFARLRGRWPEVEHVQFVDGDMELARGWVAMASGVLDARADVVAVSGIRRERYPGRTVYHRVCDVEWRIASGTRAGFGGDVMLRARAFAEVGGYTPDVIAAEDNELAIRLRARGGVLARLEVVSTLHDVAMDRFGQWWLRARRCGHAYAQVRRIHGGTDETFARELRRAWLLGLALPGGAMLLTGPTLGLSWLALALYPLDALRIAIGTRRRGFSWREAASWGTSCALAPIPQAAGAMKFHIDRLRARAPKLIEYKGAASRPRNEAR